MPARLCVQTSCGLSPSVDPVTGELILDLVVDPLGGIDCADPDGLYVKRLGSTPAVPEGAITQDCVQLIGVTDAGNLFVPSKPVTAFPIGPGSPELFFAPGEAVSLSGSYTNPTNCDQLIRIVCAQPQILLTTAPADPTGTNAQRRQRAILTPFIDTSVPNINGSSRVFTRNDYYFHADEIGSEVQWYSHLQALVHLTGGQTVNYDIGITVGNLVQMLAEMTALRCWIEVYPDGLAVPEP